MPENWPVGEEILDRFYTALHHRGLCDYITTLISNHTFHPEIPANAFIFCLKVLILIVFFLNIVLYSTNYRYSNTIILLLNIDILIFFYYILLMVGLFFSP